MPEKKPSAAKSSRAGKPPGPGKPAEQGPTTRESAAKKSGAKKVAAKRATKSSAKRDAASAPESLFFARDESWMRFTQRDGLHKDELYNLACARDGVKPRRWTTLSKRSSSRLINVLPVSVVPLTA